MFTINISSDKITEIEKIRVKIIQILNGSSLDVETGMEVESYLDDIIDIIKK